MTPAGCAGAVHSTVASTVRSVGSPAVAVMRRWEQLAGQHLIPPAGDSVPGAVPGLLSPPASLSARTWMRYVAPFVRLGTVAVHAAVHEGTLTLVSTLLVVLTAVTL